MGKRGEAGQMGSQRAGEKSISTVLGTIVRLECRSRIKL